MTPIGEDKSGIRRHIDGLIDECIVPVMNEKGYNVNVAHRMAQPGSINNQVIAELYYSNLVIANLYGLNPNVMYELAIRHCLRKPVIIIMEKGSGKIPFDTITERTVFYSNDFQGAIDFKNELIKVIDVIDEMNIDELDNPVYTALEKIITEKNIIKNITKDNGNDNDAIKYLVNSMLRIENKIDGIEMNKPNIYTRSIRFIENEETVMDSIYLRIIDLYKVADNQKGVIVGEIVSELSSILSFNKAFCDMDGIELSFGNIQVQAKLIRNAANTVLKKYDLILDSLQKRTHAKNATEYRYLKMQM